MSFWGWEIIFRFLLLSGSVILVRVVGVNLSQPLRERGREAQAGIFDSGSLLVAAALLVVAVYSTVAAVSVALSSCSIQ